MAEKKDIQTEVTDKIGNIKSISELGTSLDKIQVNAQKLENQIKSLKAGIENKLKAIAEAKKVKEEQAKVEQVEIPAPIKTPVEQVKEEAIVSAPVKEEVVEATEPVKKEKPAKKEVVEEKIPQPAPEIKVEAKVEKAEVKVETKPEPKVEVKVEQKVEVKEAPKVEEKKEEPAPEVKARPSFIVRRATEAERNADKKRTFTPNQPRERGERPQRPHGDRPQGERPQGDRPQGDRANKGQFAPKGAQQGARPQGQGGFKPKETFVAPEIVETQQNKRGQQKNKQRNEKSYEEKRVVNKRSLIKNQVDVDDFDENKTGYRKFRPVKKAKEQTVTAVKIEKAVINTEVIALKVLSEKIGITAAEITKRLFKEGIMKTINDSIDFDTAAFIAADIGVELELKLDKTAEDVLSEGFDMEADDASKLVTRPPVVTVMGHVDHGKTSLLDRIRKTNVTAGEAGGITQHIGAYQVSVGGKQITFLDTPGHAAFTAMRARGAQATDIAILVVAADDGIMPQTIEAISHAKAAEVPIIVAVNKIDKPESNIERIKTQLTEHGLLPEEWGGDTILCPVSAKTGEGFDELLESVNLVAEMRELKANPDRKAKGVVIEAKLDHSKGPIATVLIQNGTLKVSDSVVVGTVTGKIRAMTDDKGRRVNSAGPSMPVSIMGLDEVPNAGDILYAVEQEKLTKLVAEERKNKERESMIRASQSVSLDDLFGRISEGSMKGLNLIVKADVQGSVEAVKQSMEKLSNEEVKVNVIHAQAGAINESDIMLAESSKAIIIGFNVRPDSNAKQVAERSGVDIKLYRVIYEAIEDVEKAMKGMLAPKFTEVYLGKAEVREVFKISGVGQVAGCYVTEGKIARNSKLRIYRDDVMICEGNVLQLKRFKDDVKEVSQGFECGISIEKFNDIKIGDFIESYQVEEQKG